MKNLFKVFSLIVVIVVASSSCGDEVPEPNIQVDTSMYHEALDPTDGDDDNSNGGN